MPIQSEYYPNLERQRGFTRSTFTPSFLEGLSAPMQEALTPFLPGGSGTSTPTQTGGSMPFTQIPRPASPGSTVASGATFQQAPAPAASGGFMPFTHPNRAPSQQQQRPFSSMGGSFALPSSGLTGSLGSSPTTASPTFGSAGSTAYWNALLGYLSPAMQSGMGGSYQNPRFNRYFPNYYPGSYIGDPLFRVPWMRGNGNMPSWLRNQSYSRGQSNV